MSFDTESFLRDFHLAHPGCTPRSMAAGRTPEGKSSYELVIEEVAGTPGKVLDLACGDGYLLGQLAARGRAETELFGIDMSEGELMKAKRDFPNIHFSLGNARHMDFAPASFAVVSCHMALMLMPNVHEVVKEISRVLAPGGVFVAVTGGAYLPNLVTDIFIRELDVLLRAEGKTFLRGIGDERVNKMAGISELFSDAAGFSKVTLGEDSLTYDLSAGDMAAVYMETYDPFLLSEDGRITLRKVLTNTFLDMLDENERVQNTIGLRKIVATRA